MELRQLRYFLEILRHANFGRAAETLHITQPALSKSLRALEAELGVKLVERGARGVIATPYGRVLESYAAIATRELERAVEEIATLAGRGSGVVRIGGSQTFIRYFVPAALQQMLTREDGIEIVVVEGLRDDVLAALRRGEIDLAMLTRCEDEDADDLAFEKLVRDRICVVASEAHPLARRSGLDMADLAPYRWILPHAREPERRLLAEWTRAAGLPPPRIVVEGSSSLLMAQLLRGHDQLSYLPRKLMRMEPCYAGLVPLDCDLPWPEIDVCLVYRKAGVLLPAVRTFVATMRQLARRFESDSATARQRRAAR
jgi:DNA-binding transcriptional LysR family regulator